MTTPATQTLPILITGAGLSSLLLAQSLLRHRIPFHLYERDASLSFRGQGYRLRLSNEGLDAIESVLRSQPSGSNVNGEASWQKFWDRCGKTGGAGFRHFDARTGEELGGEDGPGARGPSGGAGGEKIEEVGRADESKELDGAKEEQDDNPPREVLQSRDNLTIGIARGEMRELFLEGAEDRVEFGKNVRGYELTALGVHAIFADGSKSPEGSLLVAGEGINSHVAKQLSQGQLKVFDLGARGIHGQAPTPAFRNLGEGVFRIQDRSQGITIITNVRRGDKDDPSKQFGWTMIGEPGVITAPNDDYTIIGETAAGIAKRLTEKWHPRFRPLFEEMDEREAAFWKITCSDPEGVPVWKNERRVTVLGDACHSMTPAGGIGANTAVRDSALLGKIIGEAWENRNRRMEEHGAGEDDWLQGVTEEYEKAMRVYAGEAVKQSYGMAGKMMKVKITENSKTI